MTKNKNIFLTISIILFFTGIYTSIILLSTLPEKYSETIGWGMVITISAALLFFFIGFKKYLKQNEQREER